MAEKIEIINHKDTKTQRHKDTKAQRHKGTKMKKETIAMHGCT